MSFQLGWQYILVSPRVLSRRIKIQNKSTVDTRLGHDYTSVKKYNIGLEDGVEVWNYLSL